MTTKTGPMNSAADEAALEETRAALARGDDPFGDNDDADNAPAAVEDNSAAATELKDEQADEPNEEVPGDATEDTKADDDAEEGDDADSEGGETDQAEAETTAEAEEPAAPVQKYLVGDASKIADERKELLAEKAKALKDMMDGVLDPDAYSAKEAEIQQKLDDMLVRKMLHEANVQSEQQANAAAINALIARAKKAGDIDYRTDAKAARQFDTALTMLASDPDEAGTSHAELLEKAHKAVLALRGITPKGAVTPPEPTPTPAKPRENGKGPMTLRNVPAAETPNSGGGLAEELGRLSGVAFEEAYANLSPAQRARLLDE